MKRTECTTRVKGVIAKVKNISPQTILVDDELQGNKLRFTVQGQRALTPRLNSEFANEGLKLVPGEVGDPEVVTVWDLVTVVWDKIASANEE